MNGFLLRIEKKFNLQQNKILRLLGRLNPIEFKGFFRFLQSPFFNTNPKIILFYEQLKKYYPTFDSPKLERAKLFKKLFPNRKYNYQQLANLITELTRLAENYLIQLDLKGNKSLKEQLLVQSYGKRDLFDLFEKKTFEFLKTIEEDEVSPQNKKGYLLLKSYYFHPENHQLSKNEEIIKQLMQFLDYYYWEEKLILASEIKNRAAFLNTNPPIPLLLEIKAIIEEKKDNHRLYFYYLLLEMVESKEKKHYNKLKFYFEENHKRITFDLKLIVFRSLTNYCTGQINLGNEAFYTEQFDCYKFGLKNNFILNENIISSPTFLNICYCGVILEQKNWVLNFIENYKSYLNPTVKEEILTVTYASIANFEKQHDKVIDILTNFKSENQVRVFMVKKLIIRTYFELFIEDRSYYEIFLSACLSFEKQLYRNQLKNALRIESNLNFIHLLKKTAKIISEGQFNAERKQVLIEEVTHKEQLILRYWFIKRLKELDLVVSII